jgi:hypothetical protein
MTLCVPTHVEMPTQMLRPCIHLPYYHYFLCMQLKPSSDDPLATLHCVCTTVLSAPYVCPNTYDDWFELETVDRRVILGSLIQHMHGYGCVSQSTSHGVWQRSKRSRAMWRHTKYHQPNRAQGNSRTSLRPATSALRAAGQGQKASAASGQRRPYSLSRAPFLGRRDVRTSTRSVG